jgi:mono/diheme cytochrome c family protein
MLRALRWLVVLVLISAGVAAFWIYTGRYDVGADVPHQAWTKTLIAYARDRSVEVHSAGIVVPSDLDDPARLHRAAGHYDAMCSECHLKPGTTDTELRRGLYPQPPDFATADMGEDESPAEHAATDFWVIQHGIKMTAMPAWSKAGVDDQLTWDLVAFIRALPTMNANAYRELVESSPQHAPAPADESNQAPAQPRE